MAHARSHAALLLILAWLAVFASPASGQSKQALAQFADKQRTLILEQSQRHLEYGLELRKQGMVAQSAEQIILAAELGRGQHPGANQVLSIMRRYDDAFWKRFGTKPTPGKVALYKKKATGLLLADQKDCLALGNWASARGLESEATE